jgi:PAS domain S-box-containing protein
LENVEASRLISARFLASIIESSKMPSSASRWTGRFRRERRAEAPLCYTAPEAIGRHISLVIPADRASEEDGIIARIRSGERVDHFETVRLRKDGQPVHVSLTISPIRDEARPHRRCVENRAGHHGPQAGRGADLRPAG